MVLIDGKHIAHAIEQSAKNLRLLSPVEPKLGVILVGNDPASHTYVQLKTKTAERVGVIAEVHAFLDTATTEEIIEVIHAMNTDTHVHAILVQLPLPATVDTNAVINAMAPHKDVDGFLEHTMEIYEHGSNSAMPVIVRAVDAIIREAMPSIADKKAVILGNSMIFARPLAHYFTSHHCEVSVTAPTPKKIPAATLSADIIVTALGRIHALKDRHVSDGTLIIDIGTTKNDEGIISGDVDLQSLDHRSVLVTPVPGGVGPVTVACLIHRTIELALEQTRA